MLVAGLILNAALDAAVDRSVARHRRSGRRARRRVRGAGPLDRERDGRGHDPGRRDGGAEPRAPDLPPRQRDLARRCPRPVTVVGIARAADPAVHDRPLAAGAPLGTGDDDGALVSAELARERRPRRRLHDHPARRSGGGPGRLPGRGRPRPDAGRPGPGRPDGDRRPRRRAAPLRDRPGDGGRRPRRRRGRPGRRDRRAGAPAHRRAVHPEHASRPRCRARSGHRRDPGGDRARGGRGPLRGRLPDLQHALDDRRRAGARRRAAAGGRHDPPPGDPDGADLGRPPRRRGRGPRGSHRHRAGGGGRGGPRRARAPRSPS